MALCLQEKANIHIIYSIYYFELLLVVAIDKGDSVVFGILSVAGFAGFAAAIMLVFNACRASDISVVWFVLCLAALLFLSVLCTLESIVDVTQMRASVPQVVLIITTMLTGSLRCTELLLQAVSNMVCEMEIFGHGGESEGHGMCESEPVGPSGHGMMRGSEPVGPLDHVA